MPLTTERPRVFRGTRHNRTAWYVVSPDADSAAASEWRANFAPTNRVRWQRITRAALGWLTFLIAFGAAIFIIALGFFQEGGSQVVGTLLTLLALFPAAGLGMWIATIVFPDGEPLAPRVPGVAEVHTSVVDWADDSIDARDLWELAVAVARVEQVAQRFWWATGEGIEASPDFVEDRVTPVLDAQWEEEASQLIRVADRLRFSVPDEVWDREPRDD